MCDNFAHRCANSESLGTFTTPDECAARVLSNSSRCPMGTFMWHDVYSVKWQAAGCRCCQQSSATVEDADGAKMPLSILAAQPSTLPLRQSDPTPVTVLMPAVEVLGSVLIKATHGLCMGTSPSASNPDQLRMVPCGYEPSEACLTSKNTSNIWSFDVEKKRIRLVNG